MQKGWGRGAGIDCVLGWDGAASAIQSKEWNTNSLAANLGDQHTHGHGQWSKELEGGNKAPEVTQVLASTPHTILERSNSMGRIGIWTQERQLPKKTTWSGKAWNTINWEVQRPP